jgi:hypothetical protein
LDWALLLRSEERASNSNRLRPQKSETPDWPEVTWINWLGVVAKVVDHVIAHGQEHQNFWPMGALASIGVVKLQSAFQSSDLLLDNNTKYLKYHNY